MKKINEVLEVLRNPESSGMALVVALDILFKGQCFAWEYDTIFSELEEDYDTVLSSEASDRLMALLAVKANPAHLWDASVFSNLVETLNFNECLTDTYEECSPGEVCWALKELEMFGTHYNLPFNTDMYNDDPRIFIACCIANAGWMVLTPEFEFCRDEYMRTNRLDMHVPMEKEKAILDLASKKEFEVTDEDSPIQVQVAKIRECSEYVKYRTEKLTESLRSIVANYA